ncbi:unnamed protein product [Darwinula stevensoni]|uniref:Uncharacterized protein n=1 Tax=Darwinula stevensoni TaxID=69355 RepID=A0A7R8XCK9_9CRUS|nr:unnamed protein product [Darwinula stevensoni]CAG0887672.1 unnamed protein product [Darwinula stevensoni]
MKLAWSLLVFFAFASADEREVWEGAGDECWYLILEGTYGQCMQEDCCAHEFWLSGKCPSYGGDWRCCFSHNQCAQECGSCSDSVAKEYACKLMVMHETERIFLKPNHFNELGNDPYDGAAVLSNIRDTCLGRQAKRSAYCAEAPGGCACLRGSMVKALYEYANRFWNNYGERLEVCAWHFALFGEFPRRKLPFLPELVALCGQRFRCRLLHPLVSFICLLLSSMRERRMRCAFAFSWHCEELVAFVRQYPLEELCYPGGPCSGHETWVHAAFV